MQFAQLVLILNVKFQVEFSIMSVLFQMDFFVLLLLMLQPQQQQGKMDLPLSMNHISTAEVTVPVGTTDVGELVRKSFWQDQKADLFICISFA